MGTVFALPAFGSPMATVAVSVVMTASMGARSMIYSTVMAITSMAERSMINSTVMAMTSMAERSMIHSTVMAILDVPVVPGRSMINSTVMPIMAMSMIPCTACTIMLIVLLFCPVMAVIAICIKVKLKPFSHFIEPCLGPDFLRLCLCCVPVQDDAAALYAGAVER